MPQKMAEGVKATVTAMGEGWTPRVEDSAKVGPDTLVMWSWPMKGTHGVGLQIYGADGKFKERLEDSFLPSPQAVVCQNRYIVGGGNTLRVWDAAAGYRLVQRRTLPGLGQFAQKSCDGNVLSVVDGTRLSRFLLPSLKSIDIRLGLSAGAVAALNRSTLGHIDESHTVTQSLTTPGGDTLVSWSRTAGYDPKGPREVGTQVYRADGTVTDGTVTDGTVKLWLKDFAAQRPLLLCGRYLVGGDNTLRVWDTAANYKLLTQKTLKLGEYSGLGGFSIKQQLTCQNSTLTISPAGLQLQLPLLERER